MNEQILIDMVEWFRSKLAKEELEHANTASRLQVANREIEAKNEMIEEFTTELEKYRVPAKTENASTAKPPK